MNQYAMIPVKWKHTPQNVSVFTYEEGPRRIVFCRGAIAFPSIDQNGAFTGAVSILSMFTNEDCCVHFIQHFRSYDQSLADFFKKMFDTFGVFQYYYNPDGPGSVEGNRFLCDMEMRMSLEKDSLYPQLQKMPAGTDNQAFAALDRKTMQEQFFNNSQLLDDAMSEFEPAKGFSQSPPAVQSVCLALNGITRDSWQSFNDYRIAHETQNFSLNKELFEND